MQSNDNYSGQAIGNYLIQEKLGSGEFGSVYRAQNKLIAERVVAIKLINAKYVSSQEECERFLDEARVLLKLQHPYILPVFDIGEHEGTPYIVVEYAPTGSLRSYLERQIGQQISVDRALAIVGQIGQGLSFAHQQHVVHRDLKPDNVLFNAKGEAVLADFGIAVEVATSTNRNAGIIGTPPYMAPEQFQGIASMLSDQYALGCIAYELLTGRRPFQASNFTEWAIKHTRETPVPPSQLNPAIPANVEQAILKAMAKERIERFADVAAFVAAISPQGVYPAQTVRTVLKSAAGQTVLGNNDVTIGRAPDNIYIINDSQVSGHHAVIRRFGQGYAIVDLKSTNKTFVNGQEVQPEAPRPLRQGDSIRVGATTFEYADDVSVPPTVAAPIPPTAAAAPQRVAAAATVAAPPPPQPIAATAAAAPPPPAPIQQQASTPASVYPPAHTPPPAYMYTPQPFIVQQKRSNRGLWITLIVVAALVFSCSLIGVVSYIYSQQHPTSGSNTPTANQTPSQNNPQGPKVLTLNQLYSGSITSSTGATTSISLKFTSENQANGAITVALLIPCGFLDFCTNSNGSLLPGTVASDGSIKFSTTLVGGANNGVLITFSGLVSADNLSISNGSYNGTDGESGTWSAQS